MSCAQRKFHLHARAPSLSVYLSVFSFSPHSTHTLEFPCSATLKKRAVVMRVVGCFNSNGSLLQSSSLASTLMTPAWLSTSGMLATPSLQHVSSLGKGWWGTSQMFGVTETWQKSLLLLKISSLNKEKALTFESPNVRAHWDYLKSIL